MADFSQPNVDSDAKSHGSAPHRRRLRRRQSPTPSLELGVRQPQVPTNTPELLSIDDARAHARQRFKDRVGNGETVGGCECQTDSQAASTASDQSGRVRVAGVRFRDSGRMYYFDAGTIELSIGEWVAVDTSRGGEAGRVMILPDQLMLNQLEGDLKPILRKLNDADIAKMDDLKRESADAIRILGATIRERRLPLKAISATYSYDGSSLTLNYTVHQHADRPDLRDLGKEMARTFRCRVELKQVSARDEARLLGGLGRCGRTLCCSSWLPVYPEISMNMAKTQDLALNPSKVSGVCGRLLCCLSYENEQYRQIKSVMPRLGQNIETPRGRGFVVSMQVLKEIVTVRLEAGEDVVFQSSELGINGSATTAAPAQVAAASPPPADGGEDASRNRRKRRRNQPDATDSNTGTA